MVVATGTPNDRVARFIQRNPIDLLVLPFHLHRGEAGEALDGVGVLLELPADESLANMVILMPVRSFSWGASFQRRFEALRAARPDIASSIVIAHQDELGKATLAARLKRSREALAQDRLFAGPASSHGRSRGVRLATLVPDAAPVSARTNEMLSLIPTDRGSSPSSGTWLTGEESPASAPSSFVGRRRTDPELSGAESARESFRRAAEIGARAREEAGLPPSTRKKTREM